MAGCLFYSIGSSEYHVAETKNARNPNMSAQTTIQAKVMKFSLF